MKEIVAERKDDEKNLEELAAQDDGAEKDRNQRNTCPHRFNRFTGSKVHRGHFLEEAKAPERD